MTTQKQIDIGNVILATGYVKKVFHSCQMLQDSENNILYPAYPKGAEYTYTGIDDTHGLFAYIRTNGDAAGVPLKIDSCGKSYQLTVPLRVVFFNDNETQNHEELTTQLASFTFLSNVNLVRIISDKFRLVREESPVFREKFDAQTFYVAFDITVTIQLMANDCVTKPCTIHVNPLLPCLVAAPGSGDSATS